MTAKLHERYASVEQRLSDIQLLASLSHEKLNVSFSALASRSAEVGASLQQTRADAERTLTAWRGLLAPFRLLTAANSPHTRELVVFYTALCGWLLLLGLSGRYHLGPFVALLAAALALELWALDAGERRGPPLQKLVRAGALGCFLYMTLCHFEHATLNRIYTRLGQLERSGARAE